MLSDGPTADNRRLLQPTLTERLTCAVRLLVPALQRRMASMLSEMLASAAKSKGKAPQLQRLPHENSTQS